MMDKDFPGRDGCCRRDAAQTESKKLLFFLYIDDFQHVQAQLDLYPGQPLLHVQTKFLLYLFQAVAHGLVVDKQLLRGASGIAVAVEIRT